MNLSRIKCHFTVHPVVGVSIIIGGVVLTSEGNGTYVTCRERFWLPRLCYTHTIEGSLSLLGIGLMADNFGRSAVFNAPSMEDGTRMGLEKDEV